MLPGTEIDPLISVFGKNVFGPIFTDLFIRAFDEFGKFNAAFGAETPFEIQIIRLPVGQYGVKIPLRSHGVPDHLRNGTFVIGALLIH